MKCSPLELKPTMYDYALVARSVLDMVPGSKWAVVFIELRMAFNRLYPHGTLSTTHGADFFDNILAGASEWDEKGEYGDNFRKMLR